MSLFSFLFFYSNTFSQDSIPESKDLTEEKELKFQQFFFKALSEKSIGNYTKSLENLENCNQILTNNKSVFFEFSKNYFQLNKLLLAKEYINRALLKDSNNLWMLKHLVRIHVKDKNYSEAIKTQQKIAKLNLKEREFLIRLYLQNREFKKAILLMKVLEKENVLPVRLRMLLNKFNEPKKTIVKEEKTNDTSSLIIKFRSEKSYELLKEILQRFENNSIELLKYAEEGLSLFPAQPYIYLMKSKALNYQKKYKKALISLKNGIDFVIDDKMEAEFYKEMANTHKNLGNIKEEKKYRQKSKKTKS